MNLFKIALYVRVSTEEQAENPEGSIKNQEERLREFVKLKNFASPIGEISEVFVDAGISAKDMNRPAFQRLLAKIESRDVNLILVTELSRFTRSIKDFSVLWEFLEKHECKFLSIKDNFDTSTAAGEMVMYMMATIAQFERKQTAERISHSFLARAKRGLFNGGSVPLGYEIDQEKNGNLKVVPDQAEIVRQVFKTYLHEETLAKTAKALNQMQIDLPPTLTGLARTGIFRLDMVQHILRNKAYIGVRVFKLKDDKTEEAKAVWEPIVDNDCFERVQKLLAKNRHRKRSHTNRYPYILSGVCFCHDCGDRMSGKSAHGRNGKIGYYEHNKQSKHQAALVPRQRQCDPFRVQARLIEPEVWKMVKEYLLDEKIRKKILDVAKVSYEENDQKKEEERLKKKLAGTERQMDAFVDRISRLPAGIDESLFLRRIEKLQASKKELELNLRRAKKLPWDSFISMNEFNRFSSIFRTMVRKADDNFELQTAIVRKLVHKVVIQPKGIEIHFQVGKTYLSRELGANAPGSAGCRQVETPELFLKTSGSRRLTNGGRDRDRTCDPLNANQVLSQLSYTPLIGAF